MTNQPLRLGKSVDTYWQALAGSLDDVRVYNRVLSATEVRQLYQLGGGKASSGAALQNGTTLASGLVGYWSFNGADVTDKVYDRAGTNNGYFYNAATSSAKVQGKLGQGLQFNGTSAYVRVPDAAAIDNNAFTVSAWIKYTGSQLGGIMSKASGGTEMLLLVGGGTCGNATASGKIRFDVSVSSSIACADSSASYNDGKWHLVTATRDGSGTGNMVLYVDGAQVATATKTGDMTTSQPLAIGQHIPASTWYFNGTMDEVRLYNRALSAAEVLQLYNLGK
ncbi:MAG TPA: LamG-like jellyroll fold domain-containing protein, partial [Candidatus Paceibacterota bacterium]|nr:LamG-like jellyroll fold domain-containing protein [Candidatus Paceibacterota bacterium]